MSRILVSDGLLDSLDFADKNVEQLLERLSLVRVLSENRQNRLFVVTILNRLVKDEIAVYCYCHSVAILRF